MNSKKPILLVEDDSIDVMTVKRALKDINVTNELVVAGDGEEALDYLADPVRERPGLILLDLNMPKMNGIEFLAVIKANESLRTIPTIILTTSNREKDISESFRLSAAGYILKPLDYCEFISVMKCIDNYWTSSIMPI